MSLEELEKRYADRNKGNERPLDIINKSIEHRIYCAEPGETIYFRHDIGTQIFDPEKLITWGEILRELESLGVVKKDDPTAIESERVLAGGNLAQVLATLEMPGVSPKPNPVVYKKNLAGLGLYSGLEETADNCWWKSLAPYDLSQPNLRAAFTQKILEAQVRKWMNDLSTQDVSACMPEMVESVSKPIDLYVNSSQRGAVSSEVCMGISDGIFKTLVRNNFDDVLEKIGTALSLEAVAEEIFIEVKMNLSLRERETEGKTKTLSPFKGIR